MGYYCTRCKNGSRRDTILKFLLIRRLHLFLCHVMKAFCIRVLNSISKKFEVIHYIGSDVDRCLFILNIEYIECRNIKKKRNKFFEWLFNELLNVQKKRFVLHVSTQFFLSFHVTMYIIFILVNHQLSMILHRAGIY